MDKFNLNEFSPFSNYIISADAGTGKTYSIKKIVGKMVNEYNINIDDILIVTYTDKAAGELKERIKDELKDNVDIEKSSISTFHSFCMSVIKEYPISSSSPLTLELDNSKKLLEDFIDEYIRSGDIKNEISSYFLLIKKHNASSPNKNISFSVDLIKKTFINAINDYYLTYDNNEDESIISLQNDETFVLLNEMAISLLNNESLSKYYSKEPIKKYFDILSSSTNKKLNELKEVLINNNFYFSGITFRKNKSFLDEENEAYDFFLNLRNYIYEPSLANYLVYKYLKDIYIKYRDYKIKNKVQTFDDLIFRVKEKLNEKDSKLLKELKEKYHYAIIDEFQDTNGKQFDIFKKIFLEDEYHHIIVVGDPKQSIYSFQGADIEAYFSACEEIKNHHGLVRSLSKNYRSKQEVVDSLNHLFKYFEFEKTNFIPTEFLQKGVDDSYHHALYNNQEIKGIWFAKKEDNSLLDEYEFAKFAVSQIIDLCSFNDENKTKLQIKDKDTDEYRNVNFKDFVVLARNSKEIDVIKTALVNAGIPYIRYKDDTLFRGKEIYDWKTLFEVLTLKDFTGSRRNIVKKALYTKFFNVPFLDIASDIYNHDDNEEIMLLYKWKKMLDNKNYESLIDDILLNSSFNKNLANISLITPFSKYHQIGEYILSFLLSNHTGLDVLNDLNEKIKNNSKDGTISRSTDFNCVSILTIHASKGLQFPVVISIGGFKDNQKDSVPYSYYNNGKKILSFTNDESINKKQTYEDERLYYVNFTRPQFLLIAPNHKNFKLKFLQEATLKFLENEKDYYTYIDYKDVDYKILKQKVKTILFKNKEDLSTDDDEKEKQDEINKKLINIKYAKGIYKHSYSSLSHPHNEMTAENFDDENISYEDEIIDNDLSIYDKDVLINKNIPYDENIPHIEIPKGFIKGAKLGNAIHKIFELIDFKNYEEQIDDIIIYCFRSEGITLLEHEKEYVKNIVISSLNVKLPLIEGNKIYEDKFFNLKDISIKDRKNEIEFNYNLNCSKLVNYCNGFIDLLFIYNNRYILLDYKSDTLNEDFTSYSSLSSLKEHVDSLYSIQRTLYAYILINWLQSIYKDKTKEEIFNNYFGGIHYLFVRGSGSSSYNGAISFTWDSYDKLEKSYLEIIKDKVR